MKVTKDEWIKAISQAMSRHDTFAFMSAEPDWFNTFTLFSYVLYESIKSEDLCTVQLLEKLVEVIVEILPDRKPTKAELSKALALYKFGMLVYEELMVEKS